MASEREKELAERDFVDRASTRKLKCIDSVQTRGNCIRGGKEPQGTNELFRIYDPIRNYNLEYGLGCIEHLIQALKARINAATNEQARDNLAYNLQQLLEHPEFSTPTGRCRVKSPHSGRAGAGYLAGGYAFRIQAVGSKNFTVRVYDDDLSELGKSRMRAEGKTEDEIADEVSEKLKAVGQEFRSRMPGTSFQGVLKYKVCRYPISRLEKICVPKRT